MEIKIKVVGNGFTMEMSVSFDSTPLTGVKVFEYDEEIEYGELFAFRRLIYEIESHLGLYGNKHDKQRLFMAIRPGDDFVEDKEYEEDKNESSDT